MVRSLLQCIQHKVFLLKIAGGICCLASWIVFMRYYEAVGLLPATFFAAVFTGSVYELAFCIIIVLNQDDGLTLLNNIVSSVGAATLLITGFVLLDAIMANDSTDLHIYYDTEESVEIVNYCVVGCGIAAAVCVTVEIVFRIIKHFAKNEEDYESEDSMSV